MKIIKKVMFNPLIQLIFSIFLCLYCYSNISADTIRFFLTISVCLREMLIFILPFLLFSFIAVALSSIPKESMAFVFGLILIVFISNFVNIIISSIFGFYILSENPPRDLINSGVKFLPFFEVNIPTIVSTSHALLAGVIVGFWNSYYSNKYITLTIKIIHSWVMLFMKKFFIPLLPLFVSGFLLKLFAEGKISGFMTNNSSIYIKVFVFFIVYLLLWLVVAASFKKYRIIEISKNVFPAIVTAFCTMSSAAALPLSLEAAKKNTKDKILADAVMPLTLNFHMVGDTIIIPILAMLVMLTFNHPLPSNYEIIMFGIFFVLNKFAGGGVPSGTIMVTIPVLRKYLGFDDSMTAFIIALYGIIDPIATAGNVAANNFFVIIFQKIRKFSKKISSAIIPNE